MNALPPLRLLLVLAVSASIARADDVTDSLKAAVDSYQAGNYSEALQSIEFAATVIRQKKSEAIAAILPAAPTGWTAGDAESDSASAAMFGGMVSAKRSYSRGDSTISIQVQSDSPLLQTYGMMLSNPAMLAGSGSKLETLKGQRIAVSYRADNKSGDIKAVIDGRYVVSVDGNEVAREDLLTFMGAIDFAKLAKVK